MAPLTLGAAAFGAAESKYVNCVGLITWDTTKFPLNCCWTTVLPLEATPETWIGLNGDNPCSVSVVTVIVVVAVDPSPEIKLEIVNDPWPRSPTILFSSGFFCKSVNVFGTPRPEKFP